VAPTDEPQQTSTQPAPLSKAAALPARPGSPAVLAGTHTLVDAVPVVKRPPRAVRLARRVLLDPLGARLRRAACARPSCPQCGPVAACRPDAARANPSAAAPQKEAALEDGWRLHPPAPPRADPTLRLCHSFKHSTLQTSSSCGLGSSSVYSTLRAAAAGGGVVARSRCGAARRGNGHRLVEPRRLAASSVIGSAPLLQEHPQASAGPPGADLSRIDGLPIPRTLTASRPLGITASCSSSSGTRVSLWLTWWS
jgi:hypothetical protein